jgi:murein L,D-transpeptidase YcbB/YkuD
MIQLFQDAWKKGLEPEDYDASRWDGRRQHLEGPPSEIAAVDVALTVCAMRYISDLHRGRINPKHLEFDLTADRKNYDLAQFLREQVVHSADVSEAIKSLEPQFSGYQRTEQALLRYTELARADDGEKLPIPARPVEPGQAYAGVGRLAAVLRLLGDLPSNGVASPVPQLYTSELVEAVKRFQRRHGLDEDGRLGAETVKRLNVPLSARVRQIQLTLERWRWLPTEFSAPPIIVNIPDFRLRILDSANAVTSDMRVMVGRAMRTETPVFSGNMTYIVFRPYWVVPPGILRRQILPAIARDEGYLAKNRYEIVTPKGSVVSSGSDTDELVAQLRAGRLLVRQKPGPRNALGLVKLIFPNDHAVYLHSTPSVELFSRSRRDFSSGCIRVEQPAELAAWALRDEADWSLDRVQRAMESGPDNTTVRMSTPVPVFIIYGTAIAYENGEVHFYDDLYGHDARLEAALSNYTHS